MLLSLVIGVAWPADIPQSIDVSAGSMPRSLNDRFLVHKAPADAEAAADDVSDVLSLPATDWAPADLDARSSFFRAATLWLLGAVHNSSRDPVTRLLTVEPWWLEDVRLFVVDPDNGEVLAERRAGLRRFASTRAAPGDAVEPVEATFPVELLPGERALLLVRVEDQVLGTVKVGLFEPGLRRQSSTRALYLEIGLLGFVLALTAVLLAQPGWPFVLVAGWLASTTLFEVSFQVPLIVWLFPDLTPHIYTILTMAGSAKISMFALATLMFLGLYGIRFWRIAYAVLVVAILLASAVSIWDPELHPFARQTASSLGLLFTLTWPLAAWSAACLRPRRPYQRALLALFGIFWLALTVRTFVATGMLKTDLSTEPELLFYLFAMVMLTLGILRVDMLSRRDAEHSLQQQLRAREETAQRTLLDMRRDENARLAAAVDEKTRVLQEMIARAEAGSRQKSAFLSAASHELRAPLHDILGYAQLLTRHVPAQARNQLAVIQDSGNQLLNLINEMLDFSRGAAKPIVLDRAPLSLQRLAARIGAMYRPLAACRNNVLTTRLGTDPVDWLLADEQRLVQILRNLLENACKFTENGQIELGIELAEPLPAATCADGREVRVRFVVTDTGIGIPPSQRDAVFEPFFRLCPHDAAGGLGLGLAIAQQLATAMGGRIRVASRQGERPGSRFELELLLQCCGAEEAAQPGLLPIGYRGPRRTVLIADDAASSRGFLVECCKRLGFKTLTAGDGAEALAQLRAAATRVDVALVDQVMPGVDGWAFLRAVRESEGYRHLPVVLISAAPLQPPAGFPAEVRFDACDMKPLSEARLAQILAGLLDLDWSYPDHCAHAETADAAPQPLPTVCPLDELEQFRRMLDIGQLVAIQRWARTMAERYPLDEPALMDIVERCTRVDLAGLRRIAAAWSARCADAPSS